MEFRSTHTIETSENVHINVELAGLASRVFAFMIDGMMMAILSGLVIAAFSVLSYTQGADEIAKTGIPLGSFIVLFGYHLFLEWLWNGKTLGKAIFHIRVVRNNGQPIGFWESVGRNLMRVLDVYASGIGLLCMMFAPSEKRFGDFVAGTIVINDQPVRNVMAPTLKRPAEESQSDAPEAATAPSLNRLTAEEQALLSAYQSRRGHLLADARQRLSESLQGYFTQRLHQPVESDEALDALAQPSL